MVERFGRQGVVVRGDRRHRHDRTAFGQPRQQRLGEQPGADDVHGEHRGRGRGLGHAGDVRDAGQRLGHRLGGFRAE
ncbi:hypothetical protein [Amycolatopsis sp. FDAARGOS 1241]|uniref:hypothetical protein n=1 Tax=Amycolatopsis sp. FDAARGOS 1241 TaxID=2778070 RepID=UPI0019519E09|nr:hypothetical protein [Amycolatopsis sp. FDAARGOS 1241]QRP48825.1 hypothetical protein I6J71_14010 [Amycolatopsis sp. FDAARGOS 1241]